MHLVTPRQATFLVIPPKSDNKSKKERELPFLLLGPGQIFAEEALLNGTGSTLYTVKCKSGFGEVFSISELEFAKSIKPNARTFAVIEVNSLQKSQAITRML